MQRALVLVLLAGALAACGGSTDEPAGGDSAAPARVTDLSNVLQLRAAFNDDAGKPRLLLVLSPT